MPLLVVDALGSIAFSNFFVYVAIWGKERLHATDTQLGIAFLLSALAGAVAGAFGGALSDRIGRKPVIVMGWAATVLVALVALAAGDRTLLGLGAFVVVSAVLVEPR